MISKNIVQDGSRIYVQSAKELYSKYPAYSIGMKSKVLDQLCMTIFSNSKSAVESLLVKDFSTNQIICNCEDLGIDLVFVPNKLGIDLVEFDATYKAFFRTRPKDTCTLKSFIDIFPIYTKNNPDVLFVVDAFRDQYITRHVFCKGTIEITNPSIEFQVSASRTENLEFSSAYRKYLKDEDKIDQINKGPIEDLLLEVVREINPEFDESILDA